LKPKIKVRKSRFMAKLSFWLALCPHMAFPVRVCGEIASISGVFSSKDINPLDQGPTLMTSFNFNLLL
jgi:hypothetical protein